MFLCRKPEAFREAAVAPRVVPEGGGPLPALTEGARTWGGDPAQAAHQTGLVFLEAPVIFSPRLLKGPASAGSFIPVLVVPPGTSIPPLCSRYEEVNFKRVRWWRKNSQCCYAWMSSLFLGARMCLIIIMGWFIFGKPMWWVSTSLKASCVDVSVSRLQEKCFPTPLTQRVRSVTLNATHRRLSSVPSDQHSPRPQH